MDVSDRLKEMNHYQLIADDAGIECNVIMMYQALYTQHKEKFGTNKKYINTVQYDKKMQERYDWVFEQINDTIESKLMYE